MKIYAYRIGVRDALSKYGHAGVFWGDSSPVTTTSPAGRSSAIAQAWGTNAALGQTSQMEESPILNATMRGGSPLVARTTDTMGGVNQLEDSTS